MSEPLSNAALDRLLGLAPAPPAPRADLADRIVAEATRPGRARMRAVVRRDRRRGWRRSSIITGVIALNLLAASAIASVLSGVPVHVALARLAALPAHLFPPHRVEHAAHHVHGHAKAPVRVLTGNALASSAPGIAANPQAFAAPSPTVARSIPDAPINSAVAPRPAVSTARSSRPPTVRPAHSFSQRSAFSHVRQDQLEKHVALTHPPLGYAARDGALSRRDHAAHAAPATEPGRPVDAERRDRGLGSDGAKTRAERVSDTPRTPPRNIEQGARALPHAEVADHATPFRPSVDARTERVGDGRLGARSGNGIGGRPRWASEVVVNPALDGSPTVRAPISAETPMAQQRAERARELGQGVGLRRPQGPGAGFRPGQRSGWQRPGRPPRPPKMGRMPKRPGGFGRPRGGGRRF